jgi:hypothetical protein
MNKYCILSTDNNPDYYSLLPLVCYSWKKIGYTPVIIFVNVPYNTWKKIMDACPEAKSHVLYSIDGVKDSTYAQLQRLFMGKYAPSPDDVFITADADMIIARDIFSHDVSQGQIISYGYDLTGRSELPICYVKATAAKWRELMGEFTIPDAAYNGKWETYWSVDQQLLTQRANEYGMGRITFVDRGNQNKHGLPTGRWDRHDFAHIPDSIIDVHMPRGDWGAQIQVFERLWPGEDHSFITKFREALGSIVINEIPEAYNYPSQLLEPQQSTDMSAYGNYTLPPQTILEMVAIMDQQKHKFLEGVDNWSNHRPLLLLALHLTRGDILELGSGEGSTPFLRAYCEAANRLCRSWDSSDEWAKKMMSGCTDDWDATIDGIKEKHHGLIFIDHAPGERRYLDAIALANAADVLVLHDTEEGGAGNYMWDKAWPHFKYRLNYNKSGGGAGATLVSNKIDVNRFRGLSLGQFTFDND